MADSNSVQISRRRVLQAGMALAGAGVVLPSIAACGGQSSSSGVETDPAKRLAAAKKEGMVSLYSSASTDPSNAIAEGFKKKYGIKVQVYRAGSADVATRVRSEERARRTQADTIIIEEPALDLLVRYLAAYDSPERADIAAQYKAPKYTLIRMYVAQIAWNAKKVGKASAPKDWPGLLASNWSGNIGTLDPSVTATTLAWEVMVEKQYGSDYIRRFGQNKPKTYASTDAMTQAIISGAVSLGVVNSFGVLQLADTGAPIGGIIPKTTVLYGGNVGAFRNAPHPNAARLFCDYACSAEGQSVINSAGFTIPTHPKAKSPKAGTLAALSKAHTLSQPDYKQINKDSSALLTTWDKYVK